MKRRKRALWSHPFQPSGYEKRYTTGETLEACGMCGFPWDEHEDNPDRGPSRSLDEYSVRKVAETAMRLWPLSDHDDAPVAAPEAAGGANEGG